MQISKSKVLIHFDTKKITTYLYSSGSLVCHSCIQAFWDQKTAVDKLMELVDLFLYDTRSQLECFDNSCVRLYATGIFQNFSEETTYNFVNHIFVNHGLYFNVVPPDLEQFYLQNNNATDDRPSIIPGLIQQEFRNVVICGSFQEHLQDIGIIMDIVQNKNTNVLSPWTTNVVPETLGTDFILLEGQAPLKNHRDAWTHKYIHMNKFRQADAIIICNPGGIIGQGTMFEFGFMIANYKRIIFTEQPTNLGIPFPYEIGLNIF